MEAPIGDDQPASSLPSTIVSSTRRARPRLIANLYFSNGEILVVLF